MPTVTEKLNEGTAADPTLRDGLWTSPKQRGVPGVEKSSWPFFGIDDIYIQPFRLPKDTATRVYSFGGDILVVRRKSLTGDRHKKKREQTAADLHLRKIGQGCILSQQDACLFGKAQDIQHLLAFMPLPDYVPPGTFHLSSWGLGTTMTLESVNEKDFQSRAFVIGGDEFVQVTRLPEAVTAFWSSELPVTEALSSLVGIGGEPKLDDTGYLSIVEDDKKYYGEILVRDLVAYIHEFPQNVRFAKLPLANSDFSWRSSRKRFTTSRNSLCEIGLKRGEGIARIELIDALTHSGSPGVQVKAISISDRLGASIARLSVKTEGKQ